MKICDARSVDPLPLPQSVYIWEGRLQAKYISISISISKVLVLVLEGRLQVLKLLA